MGVRSLNAAGVVPLLVAALVLSGALAGCSGTGLLRHRRAVPVGPPPSVLRSHADAAYLASLDAVQARLARAERRVPRSPHTARGLAHSLRLLAGAARGMATGLAAARAPRRVRRLHGRLVAVAQLYAQRLTAAARVTDSPGGEVAGAGQAATATSQATRSYAATLSQITTRLAR